MLGLAAALVAAAAIGGLSFGADTGSNRSTGSAPLTGSVTLTDKGWVCDGPVDLDSVTVTMTPAAVSARRGEDAIRLEGGCTGRIGRIDVTTSIADGVKVGPSPHDLVIGGGTIRCLAKEPVLHQDGIQVMGGSRITFNGLSVDCGRAGEDLINSNLFINQAGLAATPPTDVVCDGCTFGGGAAHTVLVQNSLRSGVINSKLCEAKFPALTLTIGASAVAPLDTGNTIVACSAGGSAAPTGPAAPATSSKLTIETRPTIVTFGRGLTLSGKFANKSGRRVTVYSRPYAAAAFTPVSTIRTESDGSWHLLVHPGVATSYRVQSKETTSAAILVRVRPQLLLKRANGHLVARVLARRPFRGRTVALQRLANGRWQNVTRVTLGPGSTRTFTQSFSTHGTRVRLSLAPTPGYVAATSTPLLLP